jgi:rubrerythrin
MSMSFNADEVLAMAEQIERNGAAFYRRAAEIATEPRVRARLAELAEWERGHEKLFAGMRAGLTDAQKVELTFDPEGDAVHYLRVMADRHVFNVTKDAASLLKGDETPEQVLEIAIGFERDSILFFQAMEGLVPPSVGRDKVLALIKEEVGHVAFLSREQVRLAGR